MVNDEQIKQSYVERQISICDVLMEQKLSLGGVRMRNRKIYSKITDYIDRFRSGNSNRWILIPGLRGTGKTTVLAQAYFYIRDNIPDAKVIYFSVDDAAVNGLTLNQLLNRYIVITNQIPETATNTYILLDEIQTDDDWARVMKSFYDKAPGVFLLCSGSSAVNLQSNADVAGRRATIECMYPMGYDEYQLIKYGHYDLNNLSSQIYSAIYESTDAADCYKRLVGIEPAINKYYSSVDSSDWWKYIHLGTLPFTIGSVNETDAYRKVLQSVEKVIYKDLPQIDSIDIKNVSTANSLLRLLADADTISVNKVSDVLRVSNATVSNILDALTKAELLIRAVPYGSNFSAARKNNKYLFASPTVRAALNYMAGSPMPEEIREGRLLEDIAALYFYRRNGIARSGEIFYDSSNGGADFIIRTGNTAIVFETGRGEKDSRQVDDTMSRVSAARYGVTICNVDKVTLASDSKSVFIPWRVFALSDK